MLAALFLARVDRRIFVAFLLEASLGYDAVFLMCALTTLMSLAIYAAMYLYLRRRIPALAYAS